jgi:glyoxylase-like metal-dependent hydrolase (beta-lactamase superfamily II)
MSLLFREQNIVVGPFQCNCRLLACPKTGEAALVDPGDEPEKLIRAIEKFKTASGKPVQVKYLLHTHAHLDHIGATREVRETLVQNAAGQQPAPVIALHREDEPLYLNLKMQGALFGFQYEDPLPIDHYLQHEETFQVGTLRFSVIHTPGHSPGSVCFRLHEDSALGVKETLFSGDTLFQGSVGRTDLWGASSEQMFRSIRQRILTLDGDTRVCPGHGSDTSVGIEKTTNPFLI